MSAQEPREPQDQWAPLVGRFVDDHYGSVRGRVRTHVIGEHLRQHLPIAPATVVDVGGGAGNQSIPLAALGYQATIVDPSEAMLERARLRLDQETAEIRERVRLVRASADEAVQELGGERFSAVLCHGVIMYLDDPATLVGALAALAAPGAVVSLVAKNTRVLAARHALDGDWEAALAAFDCDHQINGLGIDTRGDTVEHLSELFHTNGIKPTVWYGVRLFTDSWTAAPLAEISEEAALAVELEASRRDPYRQMSRLFHLLGHRDQ